MTCARSLALLCGCLWAAIPLAGADTPFGVTVHVGCGDGAATLELADGSGGLVQGLDADRERVAAARRRFLEAGLAGRVTAAVWDGRRLPYADGLVDRLVLAGGVDVAPDEMRRVLVPGGRAIRLPDGRSLLTRPRPKAMDEWTHFLRGPSNNAVSRDRLVGPPRCVQWVSGPTYGRHHDRLASISAMVSAGGRLLTIEDRAPALSMRQPADWRLIARNAFNGVTLWQRPIARWESAARGFRSGPVQLPRRLVAVADPNAGPPGEAVYVTLAYGGPLLRLDPATGRTVKTYKGTEGTDEVLYREGTLYLAAGGAGGKARRILAVDAGTGAIRWRAADGPAAAILPGTLGTDGRRVYFHDGGGVVAMEAGSGDIAWRRPLPSVEKRPSWSAPTVVVHDGVVLCGDRAAEYPEPWSKHAALVGGMRTHGGLALLTAMDAADGEVLWQDGAAECFHNAVDVFVIDGLVWASRGPARFFFERTRPILAKMIGPEFHVEKVVGRDPRTGEVRRSVDAAEAFTLSHHHRCYRNKATARYLILGRTGIEFIDLTGGPSLRHNWTRGMCQYGVMPANGLLYTPPHPCACYNASKVNGFFAYSARKQPPPPNYDSRKPVTASAAGADGPPADENDWPTYRRDPARTGSTPATTADRPDVAWRRELPGRLSAATSADGKVFLASVDRHTVHALGLDDGRTLWSHVAGGRVDSPPTYWRGRVIFGSADGAVQCLGADDGELLWRFLAAPRRSAIVARDQIESPWPVAGSVIVRDGVVYAFAGRSSYLDGGMMLISLDAASGRLKASRQIHTRDPATGRQDEKRLDNLYMPGLLYDVPSCSHGSLFLREARLSLDGHFVDEPATHLYSPGGFLDDNWWHRYYMIYGSRFRNGPGRGVGRSGGAPSGRLLVTDGRFVYGYGRDRGRRYRLFCSPARGGGERRKGRRRGAAGSVWADSQFPILVRAMALAGPTGERGAPTGLLILAGCPREALFAPPALGGDKGGRLAVVDAATGKRLSQARLPAPPVHDALCIAAGRVVIPLASGEVVCMK